MGIGEIRWEFSTNSPTIGEIGEISEIGKVSKSTAYQIRIL